MKCSVYIATSADGYIATPDGGVEWLDTAANPESGEREHFGDGGFANYLDSIDCMVMGRNTMEKVAGFNLSPEQWPYGNLPVFVLSKSIKELPENLPESVTLFAGDIPGLVDQLERQGHKHAYVDGGALISSFLQLGLINELCVSQAPVILGDGLPLFGKIKKTLRLSDAKATAFSNDFIQWRYTVSKR